MAVTTKCKEMREAGKQSTSNAKENELPFRLLIPLPSQKTTTKWLQFFIRGTLLQLLGESG